MRRLQLRAWPILRTGLRPVQLFLVIYVLSRRLSLIPRYVTLNDIHWLFYVKFCFRAVRNMNNYIDTVSGEARYNTL